MPVLENHRWELYAQGLAKGKTSDQAYTEAGYEPNRKNATRLKTNQDVIARVMELQEKKADRIILNKMYVTEATIENVQKALGRMPVKVGKVEEGEVPKEVFVYRGDVANGALKMLANELGLFTERKEIKHISDFDDLSDEELLEELSREARLLIEHSPPEGGESQE